MGFGFDLGVEGWRFDGIVECHIFDIISETFKSYFKELREMILTCPRLGYLKL